MGERAAYESTRYTHEAERGRVACVADVATFSLLAPGLAVPLGFHDNYNLSIFEGAPMKKILTTLISFVLFASVGFAQLGISNGIKGGLNLATFGGSDVDPDVKATTQFAMGGYLELRLPIGISIQPEVLYSVKGSKFVQSIVGVTYTNTQTITYVDIPVLLKYHLPVPILRPSIFVGPSFAVLVAANMHSEGAGSSSDTNNKDTFPTSDAGVVIGAGLTLPILLLDLNLDVRYDYGLSSLDKNGKANVYNRVVSILVSTTL